MEYIGSQFSLRVVQGDKMHGSFGWDLKNRGPVSQQVWHDKDPSPLEDKKPKFDKLLNSAKPCFFFISCEV